MNLSNIDSIAEIACFSVNQKEKAEAEQLFLQFCMQLNLKDIEHAITNCSPTVLFVLMEFLHKVESKKQNILELFSMMVRNGQNWYQKSGELVRNGNDKLQKYIANSFSRTLGKIIKIGFSEGVEIRKPLVDGIKSINKPRFRLYVWNAFIEAVSPILDSSMPFMNYRSMIYNFQDNIIPIITEELIPYFQGVEESIKINELSSLQASLSVSDEIKEREKVLLFTPQQMKFTELVFSVLREIVTFNYNITFSEYDSGQTFQSCLICFPESVCKKMTNEEFLQSIFFVTEKLMSQMPDSKFFQETLECIKKIMMSKLTYCSHEAKRSFIENVLDGMLRLLSFNNITEKALQYLLEANVKFLTNIELTEIRQSRDKSLKWIVELESKILQSIKYTPLHINNQLVFEGMELAIKIVSESISPQLREDYQNFKQFGLKIGNCFFENFLAKDINILGSTKLRDIEELKRCCSSFFKSAKTLMLIDLKYTMDVVENGIRASLTSDNINQIANVFLFVGQLCDNRIFEKNFLHQVPEQENLIRFSKIINQLFQWIDKYRSLNNSIDYIDISILIFIEKILSQCLSELNWDNSSILMKCKLFSHIREVNKEMNQDNFLIYCFKEITRNLHTTDIMRIDYTLDILKPLLSKFKWGLKRENFKETIIAKEMTTLCYQISQKSLGENLLKWRKKLFNILTSLNFDDVLDSYRENIDRLIQEMVTSMASNPWKVLYDLTGVCQSIDTITIYKYFLTRLDKFIGIEKMMNQFFQNGKENPQILKAILKLNLAMLSNKCQRLSGTKNSHRVYLLIQCLMPFWTDLLVAEYPSQQKAVSILTQLYKIFNCIAKEGHVNFFLLERVVPSYENYILNYLKSLNFTAKWALQYPKLLKVYKESVRLLFNLLQQVIFSHQNQETSYQYHKLLVFILKMNINQMKSLLQGSKNQEDELINTFDSIKGVLSYMKNSLKLEHKRIQLSNVKSIIEQDVEVKCEYAYMLFRFGIGKGNISSDCLRYITSILNFISPMISSRLNLIVSELGLNQTKTNQLLEIWKETTIDQPEEQSFVSRMKEFMINCERDTQPEIDY